MGLLCAFLSAILFAVNNVLIRKGIKISKSKQDNGVLITIIINVIILGLAFLIYRLIFKPSIDFSWLGLIYFILAGFLTIFIGRVTFFDGINRIGPSKAAAIKNSAPMFTLIFAILILGETVTVGPLIGILLIITAILIQSYSMFKKDQQMDKFGFIISGVAALSFGLGQGIRKLGLHLYNDPFAGAFIGAFVALLCFLILTAYNKSFIDTLKKTLLQKNIYFYLGGVATSLATLFFFIGIWFTKVAFVGTIVAADPVLTVILSKIFLKNEEIINKYMISAAILVFMGAALITIMAN